MLPVKCGLEGAAEGGKRDKKPEKKGQIRDMNQSPRIWMVLMIFWLFVKGLSLFVSSLVRTETWLKSFRALSRI
jgi:hypothetical protein